ncbi:MAG: GNAT family N-acetyltransferase, partial [Deltaproteobacteria bacterium]|nr:GNAT family N-acetyltransferase [Deltaproteobacteria bacterium]
VLGNPLARRVLGVAMFGLLGRVDYREEQDWQRAVAMLGSGDFRLSQDLLTWVREGRETGDVRVWVATSSRLGRIGRLSICKVDTDDGVSTALIFSHSLRPLVRGVGIGSKLLLAAERQAVRDGYQRVVRVVSENNMRSLSLDQEHYRIVKKDELRDWPEEVLRSMRPDHMLLVKNLYDVKEEE